MMTATSTGKTRCHHITREKAQLVALPFGTHGIVTLDGQPCYLFEDCGEWGLYREAVACDAGCNVIRRRTAPASLNGIAAPVMPHRASPPLTVVGDDLVAWVEWAPVSWPA
jgi:hypothetical protein